jgi:hypothetical protein
MHLGVVAIRHDDHGAPGAVGDGDRDGSQHG